MAMVFGDILTSILILLGAAVMLLSIWGTRQVLPLVRGRKYARFWKALTFLMAFFLLGYLAAAFFTLAGLRGVVLVLTGVVFLFGAVFVYLVVRLGYLTIGDLGELATSLERKVDERTAKLRDQTERLLAANRELSVARKQAEEANQLKSEFLATISHELRTPLNAIIGYTQMSLEGMAGELSQQQREYQERVFANGRSLLALIDDVLDLSKIEAGRVELIRTPFNLRKWLDNVVDQIQGLADGKGLVFEATLDDRLPDTVVGDPDYINQIALNLLGNAFKFTDEGRVELALRKQGRDSWAIVVSDTGIGIPSHAQEFIFDAFRQVDGTTRRKYSGTGLGLAIVRNLALMMGGSVRVKSQVGEGSTFTVQLPLVAEDECAAESEPLS